MLKSTYFITILTLTLTSCATIFTGTTDKITFNSTPSGATIYKNGVEQCKTPCTLRVNRSLEKTNMEYKLDGYETQLITLDKEFNVVSVVNLGNLFGWGIDALTGSLMKYSEKAYNITLSKNNKSSMINPTKVNFDTKKNIVELYVQQQK